MMEGIILIHMGCILQEFLREMILKRYQNFNGIDGIAPNVTDFLLKCTLTQDLGFAGDETMFLPLKIRSNTMSMLFRYHLALQEQVLWWEILGSY